MNVSKFALAAVGLAGWVLAGCRGYEEDRDGVSLREEKPWTKTHRLQEPAAPDAYEPTRDGFEAREDFNRFLATWPSVSQDAARIVIAKYGPPTEACNTFLMWRNKGPWIFSLVCKEGVRHEWPKAHTDVLYQEVYYKVPPDKFDDLAMFDGSVVAHRTKGTLGAMCDKEEMNFLALNLSHDIIEGKKTVEEARRFYERTVAAFMKGDKHEYTQKLQFKPGGEDAADPDKAADLKSE